MVYIAIVAGILVAATSFAWTIINSRTKAFAVQEVEQNGRFIMEKISQVVRTASDITAPARGASGSRLELVTQNPSTDPTVFNLSNGELTLQEGAGAPVYMHSSVVAVTGLTFMNRSAANGKTHNVEVQLTIEHRNPGDRQEWEYSGTFSSTIELRNE